jgi:hypothetical protein
MTPEEYNRIIAEAAAAAAESMTVYLVTKEWTDRRGEIELKSFEVIGVYRSEEMAWQQVGTNPEEHRVQELQLQ